MSANEKIYRFYFCIDPDRNGLLCEVRTDPGSVLRASAARALAELLTTYSEWLPGITKSSLADWLFLHGDLKEDVERLDPERTLHDLAIFPYEIIYIGPAGSFAEWFKPS